MSIPVGTNLTLRSIRTEFDPARGRFDVRTFEGTKEAIFGLIPTLATDQGYTIDDAEAPLYRVTVRTPDDDQDLKATDNDIINQWELLGNEIQKDIFEHPKSLLLPPSLAARVKLAEQNVTNASDPYDKLLYEQGQINLLIIKLVSKGQITAGPNETTAYNYAITLLDLLLKGTTHYVLSQFVLRKTQTVRSKPQLLVAYANMDKIHTTAQMIAAEVIPAGILFNVVNLQTDFITPQVSHSGYQWGWLKKSPTVQQFGIKFQITQEYWLEEWSTYNYALAT